ncbi:helix-turn-helix domain-containing protein [Bacteroides caccae]|uniref:helix-turn-helix domain-containing protein n=1 Tax=Bacteroides caccae TaxID=47678 RepID=UPI002166B95B|nr:helix-turn-helix transcriptional regulator [Bacteroides caccae]MCS2366391.1 helix-turn-helix domain-containing protein [Bacteroides caccae]MCS3190830.1 helix-turn-helix domain-containing protein [Bacteroides caccae]
MISRIKEIITYSGLSDRAFALRCGLAQNTLNRQLNGVRELSLSTVNAILNTFADISSEWLLRGKGQMLLSEVNNDAQNIERVTRLADTIANLQGTINEQMKTIQLLTEDNKKVRGELAMLKNERNAG